MTTKVPTSIGDLDSSKLIFARRIHPSLEHAVPAFRSWLPYQMLRYKPNADTSHIAQNLLRLTASIPFLLYTTFSSIKRILILLVRLPFRPL